MRYNILGFTPEVGQWKWSKEKANEAVNNYLEYQNDYYSEMSLEEYWAKNDKKMSFIAKLTKMSNSTLSFQASLKFSTPIGNYVPD